MMVFFVSKTILVSLATFAITALGDQWRGPVTEPAGATMKLWLGQSTSRTLQDHRGESENH